MERHLAAIRDKFKQLMEPTPIPEGYEIQVYMSSTGFDTYLIPQIMPVRKPAQTNTASQPNLPQNTNN